MNWESAIIAASATRPTPLLAETFQHRYDTASEPIRVTASDDRTWVVKGAAGERQIVNEQIVGRLGLALGAPVPQIGYVHVSEEFLSAEASLLKPPSGLQPFMPGDWHGSVWVDGVIEARRMLWEHAIDPANANRFARLAFLYGWCCCEQDHQFLYLKTPPHLVFSHDHGHFFCNAPDWNVQCLEEAPIAILDNKIVSNCDLGRPELTEALDAFRALDVDEVIAGAVAAPLENWGVSLEERVAMAEYLFERHARLCSLDLGNS
ncbi:HipA family kinase [Gemmatimonas sp.]|uniref:HipA family kinase n=1 Tax=Gemmatimonas sp. TaxID=1962908 RepID=UPI00286E8300|nr:HipA family kinase [Gemmatimonas sp.]